jgi:hypothetical protein
VTTITTLHAGHDVRYLTSGDAHGGNAGAMRYYTASGEPPGLWAGKGAAALGLAGAVDGGVMERLYMLHVGPNGEMLTRPRGKAAEEDDDQVAMGFRGAHPFASEVEVAEAVARARGGARVSVPYYDLTVSAAKSVSVLHASLKIAAQEAFTRGVLAVAGELHAEADGIEADLEAAARFAVERAEAEACYTRTGHHSSTTGEWRDGAGRSRKIEANALVAGDSSRSMPESQRTSHRGRPFPRQGQGQAQDGAQAGQTARAGPVSHGS